MLLQLESRGALSNRADVDSYLILPNFSETSLPGMPTEASPLKPVSKHTWIKAAVLLLFFLTALLFIRSPAFRQWLDPGVIEPVVKSFGLWGPAIFILFYATALCLLVPSSILSMLGAALFGVNLGFFCVWIGAILGASAAFLIARTLGRDFAAAMIGNRLKRFDQAFETNGFVTVLYIRLLNMPFTYVNFGIGLTGVRFGPYVIATALGMIISLFTFVFLGGALKDAWITGKWHALFSIQSFAVAGLYAFSFFIPKLLKKLRLI